MISHDENSQAVFVAYYPPDIHLSVIVAYCEQVARATGSDVFIIDRAVNSKALAFNEAGFGLLCMLNDHKHDSLESFEATEVESLDDGTRLYQGLWKESRPDDGRHFVIVEASDAKTLGCTGAKRRWGQKRRPRSGQTSTGPAPSFRKTPSRR